MRNSIFHIRQLFPAILIFQFCITFIFQDLGMSMYLLLIFIAFFILLEIVELVFFDGILRINKWIVPSLLMGAIILVGNCRGFDVSDTTRIYVLISAMISIVGILLSEDSNKSYKFCEKAVIYTGLLFAALMLSYQVYPSLYENYFLPHMSTEAVVYFRRLVSHGYGAPVGGSISYSLFLMNFAILFLLFGNFKLSHKNLWVNLFAATFIFLGTLLSQRRTEIVCLVLSIFLGYTLVKPQIFKRALKRHPILYFITFLVAFLVVCYFTMSFFSMGTSSIRTDNRLIQTLMEFRQHQDATNGRTALYKIAWNTFKEHPIVGIGWMNFIKYAGLTGNTLVRNAHNIYLQLITECGIFVGLLFIWLLIVNLRYSVINVRRGNANMATTMMIIYLLLAGILDNTLYYTFMWPVYMTCIHMSVLHRERS